jgi:hypothetical protein
MARDRASAKVRGVSHAQAGVVKLCRDTMRQAPRRNPIAGSKLAAAAGLLGWLASAFAERPAVAQEATQRIAGNPGAVDVEPGSGALGQILGFGPESGVRLGGVLVSNGDRAHAR